MSCRKDWQPDIHPDQYPCRRRPLRINAREINLRSCFVNLPIWSQCDIQRCTFTKGNGSVFRTSCYPARPQLRLGEAAAGPNHCLHQILCNSLGGFPVQPRWHGTVYNVSSSYEVHIQSCRSLNSANPWIDVWLMSAISNSLDIYNVVMIMFRTWSLSECTSRHKEWDKSQSYFEQKSQHEPCNYWRQH